MSKEHFKARVSANDFSQSYPDLKIGGIISSKLNYVIERANIFPYVSWVTKEQMLWGGEPFNDLPKDDFRRVPLIGSYNTEVKHIRGRRPSAREKRTQIATFGFALVFPPKSLYDLVQSKFSSLMKDFADEKTSITLLAFNRYYDDNGGYKEIPNNDYEPKHHKYISGYLFLNVDYIDKLIEYLTNGAPKWLKYQIEHSKIFTAKTQENAVEMMAAGLDAATRKMLASEHILNSIETSLTEDERLLLE